MSSTMIFTLDRRQATRGSVRRDLAGCLIMSALAAVITASCGGKDPPPDPTSTPGAAAPLACTDDLATVPPAVTVFGAEAGDYLADRFSLASGDFNGDGFDDMLVGAPLADGPENVRANSGEAYVVLGSSTPAPTVDLAAGAADLVLFGENPDDNLGFTVAGGDVNGDGIEDILVGARFARAGDKIGVGKTYVVFGRPDLARVVDAARGEQDVTVLGIDSGDLMGVALASGDVDGDGVADLILGASGGRGPGEDRGSAGEVYVVLGSPEIAGELDLAEQPPFFTVYAAAENDNLPNHLGSADLNGDGRDELLVGAPFAEGEKGQQDAGRAYVMEVPSRGGSLDLAEDDGFTRIIGADSRDGLGFYVAGGDLNGDGNDDAIIGIRDADGPENDRTNAGGAAILLDHNGLDDTIDLAENSIDAAIHGIDAGDSLGFTVASGDVNGDGLADVVLGAPIGDGCDNGRTDSGDVYLRLGAEPIPPVSDLALGQYDRSLFGIEAGDELGFSLASGDFNGDGLDDILAGALLADGPENSRIDAGEAYVILSVAPQ